MTFHGHLTEAGRVVYVARLDDGNTLRASNGEKIIGAVFVTEEGNYSVTMRGRLVTAPRILLSPPRGDGDLWRIRPDGPAVDVLGDETRTAKNRRAAWIVAEDLAREYASKRNSRDRGEII